MQPADYHCNTFPQDFLVSPLSHVMHKLKFHNKSCTEMYLKPEVRMKLQLLLHDWCKSSVKPTRSEPRK